MRLIHSPLVSLRDAEIPSLCGGAGMWLLLARVWLCEDFCLLA